MGTSLTSQKPVPDVHLTQKTVIVTGANTGIGYETAKTLAQLGAKVIVACRSEAKANEAIERMKREHSEDKSDDKGSKVKIKGSPFTNDLRVRLVGGKSDKEGRVEILYLGTWGTVCDDNWDLSDANVVCRMLGYERAENFSCCAAFGPGPGPIVLDEVECEGTEANIGHCRRSDYEAHDCDHSEDVGVLCIGHGNCSLNTTQNETEQEQQQQR
eukprot:XP_011675717.1 PREDICTED: galectin-3-binding protein-like [Strongylocentrotus purpuratus]